ncbi:MAG: Cysteine desulfurase [Myxococcales bacterium]|nr:Cysteine desulfurase [Myxococcales bacterium]
MSTQRRIYLDYNATAPLSESARTAMTQAWAEVGNPSSVHAEGRGARDRVERARAQVAELVGRPREQVVFTSGGTEANALGVLGLAAEAERLGKGRTVCVAPIDHPSLIGAAHALGSRGWTVHMLEVNPDGVVEPADLSDFGLLLVSFANHELGTMPDLPNLIRWAHARGALVHVDAVQAAGKVALALAGAHSIAISAHKLGGPQGVGALAIAYDTGLPIIAAGHQERGRRPGTENTLGIVGFGAAAASVELADWPRVAELAARLEAGVLAIEGVRIHGAGARRVGGTVNAGFADALGESIVVGLDLEGIAVATGAACTSGSVQPSPVLLGIGMSEKAAREAVRFSLGQATTQAEVDAVVRVLPLIVKRARLYRP